MRWTTLLPACHRGVVVVCLGLLSFLAGARPGSARPFRCAGAAESAALVNPAAAKPTLAASTGTRRAIALFARFSGDTDRAVPDWAAGIFDPDQPGSLSHFYDTMSLGRLQVRGEIGPRVYASTQQGAAYLADDSTRVGQFGRFSLEILAQADREIDFSRYDNDGPDGVPNSGDDDGVVDAVFIVVASAPEGFILGAATGVAGLGFIEGPATAGMPVTERSYITADSSAAGAPIQISADQGTIQQGRTLAEVVGSMCHEYGHVLGLPDLYNVDFLRQPGAAAAEDGAGVGAWCLMGWGALGWNGGDGPNSLCAWSRARLGWAQVLEPGQVLSEMELEEVGLHGQVYQLPLSRRESYYVEYRRRASTWYDRHLPAEGVLIWHVERTLANGDQPSRTRVDLEGADGRWQDAGYPLGRQADPLAGGTNLDFWAHDAAYAQAHAGNLGDATDSFDGVRFAAFTPETNPAAVSHDGQRRIRMEGLRLEEGLARATVTLDPPRVEFTYMAAGDSLAMAGATVSVSFTVANRGGTRATGLRVRLLTEDPLVEILDPEIALKDLGVGQTSLGATVSPQGFPRFRFSAGLQEEHRAVLGLELYDAEGVLLDWGEVTVTAISSYLVSGVVRDPVGQPLSGIPVAARSYSYGVGSSTTSDLVNETTRTDSTGRYELRLPEGIYYLQVQPVYDSPWENQILYPVAVTTDATFDFTLTQAYHVRGYAYDPDGNRLGGASITVRTSNGSSSYGSYTEGDGAYVLKLPAGEYAISVQPWISRLPAQVVARIRVEADQHLDLHLQPGVRLAIRVTGPQGEPVEGQVFSWDTPDHQFSGGNTFWTRKEGLAEVMVMPGVYIVSSTLTAPPYLPPASFQVEVAGDTTVAVVLSRGMLVYGRLLDESGSVLPSGIYGSLTFSPVAGGSSYGFSLGAGISLGDGKPHFVLGMPPGRYRASITIYDWPLTTPQPPNQELGTVEVRADTTFDLVVRPGITVKGRVLDQAGREITAGTGISLSFDSLRNGSYTWIGSAQLQLDGTYAVVLSPGEYRVSLAPLLSSMQGSLPQQVLGTFTADRDTTLDWIARPGERLAGRVVDAAGQGGSGLVIYASALGADAYGGSSTSQDGSFSLALFPGRYRLEAGQISSYPRLNWNLGELEVPATGPTEWSLPSGAILQVQVRDAHGLPVQARLALVRDPREWHGINPGNALITATLDQGGRAEIPMAPGRYALAAYGYDAYSGTSSLLGRVLTDLQIEGTTPVEVVLPSPEATVRLSGQVRDSRDGSAASAALQFCDEDQGIAARVSSQDGAYQVDLPPGTYSLVAAWWRSGETTALFTFDPVEIRVDSTWDIVLGAGGTAVDENVAVVPRAFALGRSYPNPFNGQTLIPYALPAPGQVELTVYNLAGQVVRRLVAGEQEAGTYLAAWDGRDDQGRNAASGVYLCRLRAGALQQVQRLALVR